MMALENLYSIFKSKFGNACWNKSSGKASEFTGEYSPDLTKINDYFSIERIHEDYTNGSFVVYYYVIEDKDGTIRFSDGCDYLNAEESWENDYGKYLFYDKISSCLNSYNVTLGGKDNKDEKYPLEMYVIYDNEDFKRLFNNLVNCRIQVCCESHKIMFNKFDFDK